MDLLVVVIHRLHDRNWVILMGVSGDGGDAKIGVVLSTDFLIFCRLAFYTNGLQSRVSRWLKYKLSRPSRLLFKYMSKEYISLKEAAKISGYSSDYIGQLIRAGKLEGKQIFSNVSWVTTEDALQTYLQKEKKGQGSPKSGSSIADAALSLENLSKIQAGVTWVAIGTLSLFILFFVYTFAASFDHSINNRALEETSHAHATTT